MNKDLAPPKNISKLYKEISSILRTARANAYKVVTICNGILLLVYWTINCRK